MIQQRGKQRWNQPFFKLSFIEISAFSLFDHSISQGDHTFRDDITQADNRIRTNACNFVDTHYDILYNIIKKGVAVWIFKTFSLFGAS